MSDIIAFGDSVLKGVVHENNAYKVSKNSFSNLCEEIFGISIANKAKFGSTIDAGEKIISKNTELIKESKSKYVVVEFGGNDCDFNWAEIAENPDREHFPKNTVAEFVEIYSRIIDEIKDMGKEPVLFSLPPIDSVRYFDFISRKINADNILKWLEGDKQLITNWHERYNLEVFKTALKRCVPVIDITSRFLETKNYSKLLCDDGIHPNEQGHAIIAETIKEYVKERKIKITD